MAEFAEQRKRLFERIEMAMVENMADDKIEKLLQDLFAGDGDLGARAGGGGRGGRRRLTVIAAHIATVAVFDVTGTLAAVDGGRSAR